MTTKSTGPRSAEGKARSSMNALKSGMYSQSLLIPGENPADFERLAAEYFERFRPVTPELRDALDRLIFCVWLLRRYAAVEASLFQNAFEIVVEHGYKPTLGNAFCTTDQQLARLHRIVNSTQRNHALALKEVERLHQAAQAAAEIPAESPQPQESQPVDRCDQFVPSTPREPAPLPLSKAFASVLAGEAGEPAPVRSVNSL